MAAPSVYASINAVSAELAEHGIAKTHVNAVDDYQYRSIDDLLDRLAPVLAKHRLCVLPRALKRTIAERQDEGQRVLFHVSLKVAFTLTSVDDGSCHVVKAYGEALDPSDKATAKAMSAAYKSAMIQTFCIPLAGSEEPDRASPRATSRTHVPEPVQGWEQWARDIEDIVSRLGHRIIGVARTRKEAGELAKRSAPGIILADIQLADGSSGIDAVNDLLGSFEVPVIFITAYPERFLTGERPEPAFLIAKPFQPAMVSAIASQALFFSRNARTRKKSAA